MTINNQQLTINNSAFTLVELLVVISIVGVLIALSAFGLQGARETSRDSRRKADLEAIRSGIEIYKSDCNSYPAVVNSGSPLNGDGSIPACSSSNTYIAEVPDDPTSPNRTYRYYSNGIIYEICASLEQEQLGGNQSCGGSSSCGSSACNYKVVNP